MISKILPGKGGGGVGSDLLLVFVGKICVIFVKPWGLMAVIFKNLNKDLLSLSFVLSVVLII